MTKADRLAKLMESVPEWNKWKRRIRKSIDLAGADLSGADLKNADLSRAILFGADLSEAKLGGANLAYADLAGAGLSSSRLEGANLYLADLRGSDLSGADLTGTDLSGTNLFAANLHYAILSGAKFQNTIIGATIFGDTNLRDAVGLEGCKHYSPSIIDHATLAQSGPLPHAFLRGCGLPENYITYLTSLVNQPIQFYSCFISYSTQDQEFADRLYDDLQNKGVRCWFAPHDMAPGKKIHEQIDAAIQVHDRLLLIISEDSMRSSWVKTEIAKARAKEAAQHRQVLFPIRLVPYEAIRSWKLFDSDIGDDSAAELRQYFIPDFQDLENRPKGLQRELRQPCPNSLQTKTTQQLARNHNHGTCPHLSQFSDTFSPMADEKQLAKLKAGVAVGTSRESLTPRKPST